MEQDLLVKDPVQAEAADAAAEAVADEWVDSQLVRVAIVFVQAAAKALRISWACRAHS
jgi:hypothetical protein